MKKYDFFFENLAWCLTWPSGAMKIFCWMSTLSMDNKYRVHQKFSKKWQANHYHLQVFLDLDWPALCPKKRSKKVMASVWFQLRLKKSYTKETKSEQISRFHACAHIYPFDVQPTASMSQKVKVIHPWA